MITLKKFLCIALSVGSLSAMNKEWDTRFDKSSEQVICSFCGAAGGGFILGDGIVSTTSMPSFLDHFMGSWAVPCPVKVGTGLVLAMLSAAKLQEADHSCCVGCLAHTFTAFRSFCCAKTSEGDVEKKVQ